MHDISRMKVCRTGSTRRGGGVCWTKGPEGCKAGNCHALFRLQTRSLKLKSDRLIFKHFFVFCVKKKNNLENVSSTYCVNTPPPSHTNATRGRRNIERNTATTEQNQRSLRLRLFCMMKYEKQYKQKR